MPNNDTQCGGTPCEENHKVITLSEGGGVKRNRLTVLGGCPSEAHRSGLRRPDWCSTHPTAPDPRGGTFNTTTREEIPLYMPEICVRAEFSQTDVDTLREWHVCLGGSQRGGMSMSHGYMATSGPMMADAIDTVMADIRALLEAYCVGLGGWEPRLPL
jgi:hypothetical protein